MDGLTVQVVEPLGDSINVHVEAPSGQTVVAKVAPNVSIVPGQRIALRWDMACAHIFSAGESGERIG